MRLIRWLGFALAVVAALVLLTEATVSDVSAFQWLGAGLLGLACAVIPDP